MTAIATLPLAECGTLLSGGTPARDNPTYWGGGIPWFSSGEIRSFYLAATSQSVTPRAVADGAHLVPAGTVLFVVRGMSLAKEFRVGVTVGEATLNQDVKALVPNANFEPRYLARFLAASEDAVLSQAETSSHGTKRLPSHVYESIAVPVLPMPEQRRIADMLDKADVIRRKRKAAIALADDLLRSTFLDMFGDPVSNPKGWPVKLLGALGELDRGRSRHRPRNDPRLLGGPHPLIQTAEVANCHGVITAFEQTYSDFGLSQSQMWPAGTLCITIAANIAKTGVLAFDACFPDSVVGFTPNSDATIEYVQAWLDFLQPVLERQAPQSAQKNINLEMLRALAVPTPPMPLQQRYASIVTHTRRVRDAVSDAMSHSECLLRALVAQAFPGSQEAPC